MELNGFVQVFLGGMLGPLLVELIKLAAWRDKVKIKEKYKHWNYWIATTGLLLASAVIVVLNGTDHVSALKAVQLGVNAPAIVAGYANASVTRRSRKKIRAAGLPQPAAKIVDGPKSLFQNTTELMSW